MSSRSLRAHRRRTLWEDARNLPNLLTFLRVLIMPVVLLLLDRGGAARLLLGGRGLRPRGRSPTCSTATSRASWAS